MVMGDPQAGCSIGHVPSSVYSQVEWKSDRGKNGCYS
jgi:hypothetical protein